MDVMDRFHAEIRQSQLFATGQRHEHPAVEMSGGVERMPAGPDQVAGMGDGGGKSVLSCFAEKISLDLGLADAIGAERRPALALRRRGGDARSVDPDRAGMEEMLDGAAELRNQLLGALPREADHVDDDLGLKIADA